MRERERGDERKLIGSDRANEAARSCIRYINARNAATAYLLPGRGIIAASSAIGMLNSSNLSVTVRRWNAVRRAFRSKGRGRGGKNELRTDRWRGSVSEHSSLIR